MKWDFDFMVGYVWVDKKLFVFQENIDLVSRLTLLYIITRITFKFWAVAYGSLVFPFYYKTFLHFSKLCNVQRKAVEENSTKHEFGSPHVIRLLLFEVYFSFLCILPHFLMENTGENSLVIYLVERVFFIKY